MYSELSPEVLELRTRIVELESLLIALMSENSVLKAENERLLGKVPGGGGSGVSGSPKASNPLGIKSSVPQTEGDAPRKLKASCRSEPVGRPPQTPGLDRVIAQWGSAQVFRFWRSACTQRESRRSRVREEHVLVPYSGVH